MNHYITNKVLGGLGVICFALACADFFRDRHGTFSIEAMPLFFCAFGFFIYVVLIFAAKGLRRLALRSEDYYGRASTDAEDEASAGVEARDA